MKNINFAPEVSALPLHTPSEFEDLKQSMRDNGYLAEFPIITYKDRIYDGRNRYLAAQQEQVEPVFKECDTLPEALSVAEASYLQRCYSKDQKIQVKAHFSNIKYGQNYVKRKYGSDAVTITDLAKSCGVSLSKMKKVVSIKNCVDDGLVSPSIRDRIILGNDSNNAAYEAISIAKKSAKLISGEDEKSFKSILITTTEDAVKLANDTNMSIIEATRVILGNRIIIDGFLEHDNIGEFYTPPEVIDLARDTMGSIDLDPASSRYAQHKVNATHYFTSRDNSLERDWFGNVLLNPPWDRTEINKKLTLKFSIKLVEEFQAGKVEQCIVVCYSDIGTAWYNKLLENCSVFALTRELMNFDLSNDLKQVSRAQSSYGKSIFFFGRCPKRFIHNFQPICHILQHPK